MNSQKFYSILDKELVKILDDNQDDKELHKHKNVDQNKGYALLIWFLDFYGQIASFKQYITEGKDDGSCDIIFSNKDSQGQIIYYVIQSKWVGCKEGKEHPTINKEEFNAVISDFSSILSADKPKGKNEKFNKKYDELIEHLENNGKAKFVFFTLSKFNDEVVGNINSFNKAHYPNVSLEVVDIEKIKRDYIEFNFKGIKTANPLEYKYDPEDNAIDLCIERNITSASNRDFLEFDGRDKAFIFILKPSTIHSLFSKYKFSLFYKNVRNPLHSSNYNERIVKTLLERPSAFWYFNNGVTAITKIVPSIGTHATVIQLQGLQIINGAQTVYSIYKAYEQATEQQRKIMDADARITFRLIRSSDEDFNLEITRYNNLQNRMHERDFVSNHDEQQRIQNESFETNYWYEKRRDEFVVDNSSIAALGVSVVSNDIFAFCYMNFWLQKPVNSIMHRSDFFVTKSESASGLYEFIFNKDASFKKMLSAYVIWLLMFSVFAREDEDGAKFISGPMADFVTPIFSLTRIVLEKILFVKYKAEVNVSEYLIKQFVSMPNGEVMDSKTESSELVRDVIRYCANFIYDKISLVDKGGSLEFDDESESGKQFRKLMTEEAYYEVLKHEMENKKIKLQDLKVATRKKSLTGNKTSVSKAKKSVSKAKNE